MSFWNKVAGGCVGGGIFRGNKLNVYAPLSKAHLEKQSLRHGDKWDGTTWHLYSCIYYLLTTSLHQFDDVTVSGQRWKTQMHKKLALAFLVTVSFGKQINNRSI